MTIPSEENPGSGVALLVLFNHKFERNLEKLREIYSGRFSKLFFIMPFYQGSDRDVLSVYGNSFFFQGYIAQALQQLKDHKFRHYIIIGDDLVLNPRISQESYTSYFKLSEDDGFIPEVFLLHDQNAPRRLLRKEQRWFWNNNAVAFRVSQKGIQAAGELPSPKTAAEILKAHGYTTGKFLEKKLLKSNYPKWRDVHDLKAYVKHILNCMLSNFKLNSPGRRTLHYPVVGSYADIVIIPQKSVGTFGQYCGVMAALNLFVEMAIPTALLLSVKTVVQETNLELQGTTLWEPDEVQALELRYDKNLDKLFSDFPEKTLYIHPVKLSGWN